MILPCEGNLFLIQSCGLTKFIFLVISNPARDLKLALQIFNKEKRRGGDLPL